MVSLVKGTAIGVSADESELYRHLTDSVLRQVDATEDTTGLVDDVPLGVDERSNSRAGDVVHSRCESRSVDNLESRSHR